MALGRTVELTIDGIEEPIVVTYDARDMRAWEADTGKSVIAEPTSVSILCWLGWHAAERTGVLNGHHKTWDAFDAVCTGVKMLDQDPPGRRKGSRKVP